MEKQKAEHDIETEGLLKGHSGIARELELMREWGWFW